MPSTIGDLLRQATQRLTALPQATPRLEAELLLCDAAALSRTQLLAWPDATISRSHLAQFKALLQRRLSGEPIAYILGRKAFWTLELRVTPHTLIPRPETELLVELTLERLDANAQLLVLDAGSGSGAIASALASERPAWTLIATDNSLQTLRVARENLMQCAPANARVICADWLAPIAARSLHAVVANPPYIPQRDPHLRLGDLPWEPLGALAAGADGLDGIRTLIAQAATRLKPAGLMALEHGPDQGRAVRAILAKHRFEDICTHRDLGGHERATTGLLSN